MCKLMLYIDRWSYNGNPVIVTKFNNNSICIEIGRKKMKPIGSIASGILSLYEN